MGKKKRILIPVMAITLSLSFLTGCRKTAKKAEGSDVTIIESEGDIEIIVPEDQEFGGE